MTREWLRLNSNRPQLSLKEPDGDGILFAAVNPNVEPRLLRDQIVGGPHYPIWTGRADFHAVPGNLVKEIRRAPAVDQFTVRIKAMPRRRTQPGAGGIPTHDC